jgi:hypothetical protein
MLCHTPLDPDVPAFASGTDNMHALCGNRGSLIPHLWRDGILAAKGERVATTTAHCVPSADWVETLLSLDLDHAAIGGTIQKELHANAQAEAIFLLRYAAYAPPQERREVRDLAADNAVYCRGDLLRHGDLLRRGFWEPSFHERFHVEGIRLELDPRLKVIHRNRYSAKEFVAQRFSHGREFGLTRAGARPIGQRVLLALAVPGAIPLLVGRILRKARSNPDLRKGLLRGSFWLALFVLAWVAGEAAGYAASLRPRALADYWRRGSFENGPD